MIEIGAEEKFGRLCEFPNVVFLGHVESPHPGRVDLQFPPPPQLLLTTLATQET